MEAYAREVMGLMNVSLVREMEISFVLSILALGSFVSPRVLRQPRFRPSYPGYYLIATPREFPTNE